MNDGFICEGDTVCMDDQQILYCSIHFYVNTIIIDMVVVMKIPQFPLRLEWNQHKQIIVYDTEYLMCDIPCFYACVIKHQQF